MRFKWLACLCTALLAVGGATANAQTQSAAPVYIVTYYEVIPAGQHVPAGPKPAEIFRRYTRLSVKEPGAVSFNVMRAVAAQNHYVVLEVWDNQNDFTQHESAPAAQQLATAIDSWLIDPSDQRVHTKF